MSKQLKMGIIKEDNKKFDQTLSIDVKVNDEDYEVKIWPFFSPTKVADMRNSLIEFKQNCDKEELIIDNSQWDDIISYFIVRQFTDIKMTTSKKAKTIYAEFKEATNSKLFEVILKSFQEDSLMYVHDKIFELAELNAKLENKVKQTQKEIKDLPLENKELLLGKKKQIPEV